MLSEKEKELVNFGLQNGKSPDEIKKALAKFRTVSGYTPGQSEQADAKPSTFAGTQDRLAEVGTDTANTISQSIKGEGDYAGQSSLKRGVTATAAGFSSVPKGAYAMAPEPVRKGLDYVGGKVGAGFKKLTDAIGGTELFKGAAGQQINNTDGTTSYQKNDLGTLEDGLGVSAGLSEITGNILGAEGMSTGLLRTVNTTNRFARQAFNASDDVLARIKAANPVTKQGNFLSNAVNDTRYKLSDVDPQVETVLKRSNYDEVNTYFQQARNAKADPSKSTPLEIAGTKAEEAYDAIDEARKNAISGKKAILAEVADQRVPGNTLNETMSAGIQRMGERFGVKVDANGTISPIKGRTSTLDAKDAKLISDYYSKLNAMGVSPTVKQVDDFVDWAQGQLYKQEKTLSKLDVASDPVIRELQKTTGDLNTRLKGIVGNGYGEVNARISDLITLQDELSRALGADARKGGGLMKTLFSPTGGNTRSIFNRIQQETGIDLFKEATLAKYAMESVDDVRQASLLKQLDVAVQTAAELDLTKPMSIYKWLKERGDMDGQELANEIIKRSGLENPK